MPTTTFTVTTKNILGPDLRLAIAQQLALDITNRCGVVAEQLTAANIATSSA